MQSSEILTQYTEPNARLCIFPCHIYLRASFLQSPPDQSSVPSMLLLSCLLFIFLLALFIVVCSGYKFRISSIAIHFCFPQ